VAVGVCGGGGVGGLCGNWCGSVSSDCSVY